MPGWYADGVTRVRRDSGRGALDIPRQESDGMLDEPPELPLNKSISLRALSIAAAVIVVLAVLLWLLLRANGAG